MPLIPNDTEHGAHTRICYMSEDEPIIYPSPSPVMQAIGGDKYAARNRALLAWMMHYMTMVHENET